MRRTTTGQGTPVTIYRDDRAFDLAHTSDGPPVQVGGLLYFPDGAKRDEGTPRNFYFEPSADPAERARAVLAYWTHRTAKEEDSFRALRAGADQLTMFNLDYMLPSLGVSTEADAKRVGEQVRRGEISLSGLIIRMLREGQQRVKECRERLAEAGEAVHGTSEEWAKARDHEQRARKTAAQRPWSGISID